jgi:hypothetical protein
MEKVCPETKIRRLIHEKEMEHKKEGALLKEHFNLTYESLKSVNLLESALKTALSSPDLKSKVASGAIKIITRLIAKKVFPEKSHPENEDEIIFRMVVASKVSGDPDELRCIARIILKKMTSLRSNFQKVI